MVGQGQGQGQGQVAGKAAEEGRLMWRGAGAGANAGPWYCTSPPTAAPMAHMWSGLPPPHKPPGHHP